MKAGQKSREEKFSTPWRKTIWLRSEGEMPVEAILRMVEIGKIPLRVCSVVWKGRLWNSCIKETCSWNRHWKSCFRKTPWTPRWHEWINKVGSGSSRRQRIGSRRPNKAASGVKRLDTLSICFIYELLHQRRRCPQSGLHGKGTTSGCMIFEFGLGSGGWERGRCTATCGAGRGGSVD